MTSLRFEDTNQVLRRGYLEWRLKTGKGDSSRQRREHIGKPKEKRKYRKLKKSLATASEKVSVLKANEKEVIVRLQENRVLT